MYPNLKISLPILICLFALAGTSSSVQVSTQSPNSTIRFVNQTTGDPSFTGSLLVCINDKLSAKNDPFSNSLNENGFFEVEAKPGKQSVRVFKTQRTLIDDELCSRDDTSKPMHTASFDTVAGETYTLTVSGKVISKNPPKYGYSQVDSIDLKSGQIALFNQNWEGNEGTLPVKICINDQLAQTTDLKENITVNNYPKPGDKTTGYAAVFDLTNFTKDNTKIKVSWPYYYIGEADCSLADLYADYGSKFTINTGEGNVSQPLVVMDDLTDANPYPDYTEFTGYTFSENSSETQNTEDVPRPGLLVQTEPIESATTETSGENNSNQNYIWIGLGVTAGVILLSGLGYLGFIKFKNRAT